MDLLFISFPPNSRNVAPGRYPLVASTARSAIWASKTLCLGPCQRFRKVHHSGSWAQIVEDFRRQLARVDAFDDRKIGIVFHLDDQGLIPGDTAVIEQDARTQ
jgi:hypothetical protein